MFVAQVDLMVLLLRELAEAYARGAPDGLRRLPEYRRLLAGAPACGFVCSDIDTAIPGDDLAVRTRELDWLRTADFLTVRKYVHTLVRAERHADGGADLGGGAIHAALESGAIEAVAERLESAELRGEAE